ncbi:MAG: acyl carrier protein [Gammaproteobacteria bacterium]|nr:acyl carrier protein [Gammaproteobacteria bacterium]
MMEYDRILADLYKGLEPLNKSGVNLTENTELLGDLDLDSLKTMELLLYVEDSFDISIPVSILPDVKTVGDLAKQIEKIVSGE